MTRRVIRWILAGALMPTALLPAAVATAVLMSAVLAPAAPAWARENLLTNPGAEQGETGWQRFFLERGDARLEAEASARPAAATPSSSAAATARSPCGSNGCRSSRAACTSSRPA